MRKIKKFPKSPIRPAGRVLTFIKHQICSPSCRSRLNEHLSFNMIENLLCLGFISLHLWFCYVILTRSILSTPACDVLLYVRLKTTCAAIKLRRRLLWSLWVYAHDFQRHLLLKLIVVNEKCCLCTCFTEWMKLMKWSGSPKPTGSKCVVRDKFIVSPRN